jgi:hypothetical protein
MIGYFTQSNKQYPMEFDNITITNDQLSAHGEDSLSTFNITGAVDVNNDDKMFIILKKIY